MAIPTRIANQTLNRSIGIPIKGLVGLLVGLAVSATTFLLVAGGPDQRGASSATRMSRTLT